MEIGTLVRQLRESQGMSQDDLAKAAGINQGVLSRYESGNRPIPHDSIIAISKALGEAPELVLAACRCCPLIQMLQRFYAMPTEDDVAIEQMLYENEELVKQLIKLRENQPVKGTHEYGLYLSQVKILMSKLSISASAYSKTLGIEE